MPFAVEKEYYGEKAGYIKGTLEKCKRKCDETPQCRQFVYNKKHMNLNPRMGYDTPKGFREKDALKDY